MISTGSGTPSNLVPAQLQEFFPSSSERTVSDDSALSNVATNLFDYLRTGESPSDLRSSEGRPEVLITAGLDVDFKELSGHMWIRSVFTLGFGYIIQGFVNTPKDLTYISTMHSIGTITGNQFIETQEEPDAPATDQFMAREIMGIEDVMAMYPDFNGTGITIGICDTGTDFGVTDLATAYDTDGGVPTSFDPGGTGLALTWYSLPARRRGGGAGDYLLTANLTFTMYRGEGPSLPSSAAYGIEMQDMLVGGVHGIVSQSGYYQVGMSVQHAAGLPSNRAFFVYILVDSVTAGVYDTLYIDFETSFALTAEYNGLSTWITADWDFTNNAPHRWGDGTEVLAVDFDFDGVNDYSMGMLSNTFDLYGLLTGELVSGILPDGSGFAVMYDYAGHGTGTAGSAAGRGVTEFDVYGNGTLYTVPGAAPGATIMALKLFTWGDYMNTWIWGCGYDPIDWNPLTIGVFSNWTYTGDHKADILSNSWGFIDFEVGYGPMPYGYDWYSQMVDFLSYWTNTLFCISAGNAGPGYGTGSSPYAVSAMMVGASTTSHWAQPLYGEYPQGYDTMADFSSAGPTPLGSGSPSVVAIGAYAFDVYALHYGRGDGLAAWVAFGGTSQSCPLAAGVTAIVMQAMAYSGISYGSFGLTSSIAKAIVMNGADDIGYDVYRQGAGRVNAFKAINLAFGNETDGSNDLISIGTQETFDQIFAGDRQCSWRGWYINMYYGWEYGINLFDYPSFYHPGYEYGPDAGVWDGAAFPHPIYRGDSYSFNVTASLGTAGASGIDALDAYTYQLTQEANALLVSTSTYTTFNLTAEFGTSFMSDFMAADYATIMLTYPLEDLEAIYALATTSPYVFLHDWMNDTNGNGIIDLTGFGVDGEVRRISADTSISNCHQISLGNPGSLFQKTPALYYHDVGVEFFLWRQLDVNVTIRLYDRVPWSWIATSQYGVSDPNYPYMWQVTATIPGGATPGFYEGFLEATTATGVAYMPLSIRVDANMASPGAAGAVSWGGSQGTPYDNGATYGGLAWNDREAAGDWRFYFVDAYPYAYGAPPGGTPPPSYYLVNVTWTDPDTRLDIYFYYSSYGYDLGSSDFQYVNGRWEGTSTWSRQNVMFLDVSRPTVGSWQYTWLSRGSIGIAIRTSAFGGHTGGPEDFWVTVSYTNTNHADYPSSAWSTPTGWLNVTNPASYLGAAIHNDTTYIGPHVTFKTNWSQLVIPDFPAVSIRQARLELLSVVEQEHYGNMTENQLGGWHPDTNPREGYDYVDLLAGQNVYFEVEFGSWVDPMDPSKGLTHGGSDDCDVMVWAPGAANTYANSLTGATTAGGSNPEAGTFVAPTSGTYTIGIDWYSGVWPMGWRCYVYAYQSVGVTTDGLASQMDTSSTDTNAQYDVRAVFLTGTNLDGGDYIENSLSVPRVTVTNFFAPTVSVTSPNGGESFDRKNPITITWTAGDANVPDETLGFSVEVSNNSGTTWKVVIFGTTLQQATWNPSSAYYGLPAGTQFLVRVNVTDGRYTASDVSDATFTITETIPPPQPPWELITVIIVAVVVVIILLATCLLKRRQTPTK